MICAVKNKYIHLKGLCICLSPVTSSPNFLIISYTLSPSLGCVSLCPLSYLPQVSFFNSLTHNPPVVMFLLLHQPIEDVFSLERLSAPLIFPPSVFLHAPFRLLYLHLCVCGCVCVRGRVSEYVYGLHLLIVCQVKLS